MTTFKIVCVYVFPDCLTCFPNIGILSKVYFFVFEATEPSLNHNVISPTAFAIHTLTDMVIFQKTHIFVACELAPLI